MIIDGIDVSTIGVKVQERGNSRGTTRITDPFAEIPGAWTTRRLGRGPVTAKPITLTALVEADTVSGLRTNLDKLIWYVSPGPAHILSWTDDTTREWVVHFSEVQVTDQFPQWTQPTAVVTVNVMAEDPRGRNPIEQTVSTSGALPLTLTPSAMGDAPMPVNIEITGGGTPITIEYRNSADTVLGSFTWSGASLGGGDILIIKTADAIVTRNGVNDIENITDTDGVLPFDMDPNNGDFIAGTYPDINLTGAGTTTDVTLRYRERYW